MIELTDYQGNIVELAIGHIEAMQEVPDTVLLLRDGRSLVVREPADAVLDLVTIGAPLFCSYIQGMNLDRSN